MIFAASENHWRTPTLIIVAGCLISMVGFGVRSTFGLFLEPMTAAHGWSRETFALAIAIQNLLWGICVPVAGALADRYGPSRVLGLGAVVYGAGVWGMAVAETSTGFTLAAGLLTGTGTALTAFSIALAAMAQVISAERRSLVLGIGTAAGSFGQVLFSPISQWLISDYGWQSALFMLSASALLIVPLAWLMGGNRDASDSDAHAQTISKALAEAAAHRGYLLLNTGFFVCGFHVAFIAVHFPAYVQDLGMSASVGAYAIALIGLFNIIGSFVSGVVGLRYSKKMALSFIYAARAFAITALLLAPKTELTIYLFAGVMGLLWLSTVPLTSGIVAQLFGVRYMATLFGIVFFSHQLGSFMGVWLGGYLHDTSGTYDVVWWTGVVLSVVATLLHLPIDERPVARLAALDNPKMI